MPNHRGSGKQPNGSRRGQAPSNRGRGQTQTSRFADTIQPEIMGLQDADDFLVLNFADMGVLSVISNGDGRGSRGRGARGARHFIPGPSPQHNHRGQFTPPYRGRGRGRGGYTTIPVVMGPPPGTPPRPKPHQNAHPFFRGRGGGLGFVLSPERPGLKNWDLSTRPLLKPMNFVRAKERLFEADPEELLQAHKIPPLPTDQLDPQTEKLAEAFEEQEQGTSAMPTAYNSGQQTPISNEEEAIITKLSQNTTTMTIEATQRTITTEVTRDTRTTRVQEDLLAILLDAPRASAAEPELDAPSIQETASEPPIPAASDLFYIDTTPQPTAGLSLQVPQYKAATGPPIGEGEVDEPDEIILIPSPAARRVTSMANLPSTVKNTANPGEAGPAPPTVTMETLSLSFTKEENTSIRNKSLKSFSVGKSGRSPFVPLRARKEAKRHPRGGDEAWMNSLGNVFGFKDGRDGLRRGDSDLDVGSSDDDAMPDDNGMEVDGDLDAAAMARFAREMNKPQMSMQDVDIEAALQNGDYDSGSGEEDENEGGDDIAMDVGVEIVFKDGDVEDDDDEDWSSDDGDDVDMTPNTNFKARLQRVRERTPAGVDSREADRAINGEESSWADRDEEFIAQIEDILDENSEILGSKAERRARNAVFRALHDGDDDYPFNAVTSRYKNMTGLPEELAAQFQKDRNKKAERKRLREQERAEQGGSGNGKKKGVSRNPDLEEIEEMMRDLLFATGPGVPKSFELPGMPKAMRVKIHAMAQALSLKSTSFGKKNVEHKPMTISRAKNSGMRPVNEGKLDQVMKRKKGTGPRGAGTSMGGHIREGEVIGHKAAKIDEGNIGYRLLAQMGWTEGDKIGREGGLEAPIVAIMKKSKLGLGASYA